MAKIGVFDSGIGGLTLAAEIKKVLPEHSIIYFGDTAHFPYGEKSTTSIQVYAIKICNLLLEQGCEIILIACNSASASSYELVKEYVGKRAKVFNVIDSVVDYVCASYSGHEVGLIGTKRTVDSCIYEQRIQKGNSSITLHSLATPLLAPMIEEGFFKKSISKGIISEYLSVVEFENISAIILGCTHYPLIKEDIEEFFKNKVGVVDSPDIVVKAISEYIKENNIQSEQKIEHKFYVSDYTESFNNSTKIFFGEKLNLEEYKLWE
jgi:glutamate racemase